MFFMIATWYIILNCFEIRGKRLTFILATDKTWYSYEFLSPNAGRGARAKDRFHLGSVCSRPPQCLSHHITVLLQCPGSDRLGRMGVSSDAAGGQQRHSARTDLGRPWTKVWANHLDLPLMKFSSNFARQLVSLRIVEIVTNESITKSAYS